MNVRKPLVLALVPAFLLLAVGEAGAAPQWAVRIGESAADYSCNSIEQTPDGGYVLVGERDSDAWCARLDALGSVLWQYGFGGAGEDRFSDVCALSDGSCFITGTTQSSGAGDLWCLLLGAAGNVIWQKTYGGSGYDYGTSGAAESGGGLIVTGTTHSFDEGREHVFCMKLDAGGGVVWTRLYGNSNQIQESGAIQQTADGGFVFTGAVKVPPGPWQIWCVKTDSSGSISWQRGYGDFTSPEDCTIQQTSDGGYILCAQAGGPPDSYILKLTPTGNITWQSYVPYTAPEHARMNDVRQTSDGGYILAGDLTGETADDAWFMRLDSNGVITWQKSVDGGSDERFGHVRVTAQGGLLFAGIGGDSPSHAHRDCALVTHHSSTGDIDASCSIQ